MDNPATVHRYPVALQTVSATFRHRVPQDKQASKVTNVWPVENIWSIIKDKVAAGNPKINSNKKLCRDLIKSIPARLEERKEYRSGKKIVITTCVCVLLS